MTQNDCIDPSSRQVRESCSNENLNHIQSKYISHHVSNKAQIGHLNNRSLNYKIDDIRWIVDKTILTFFVSAKLGYMNT